MPNGLPRVRTACEVPTLVGGVAPCPSWVPMPSPTLQFGILTIGYWPPSGGEGFLENCRRVNLVDHPLGQNVNRCPQNNIRIKGLDWMGRVDMNSCDQLPA